MMPNKSIYRDADAAEINLYELNFQRERLAARRV